jgi:hypothetical protein
MRASIRQAPNDIQAEALRLMAHGDGRIFRVRGGQWTCAGVGSDSNGDPKWSVPTQTIRMMEARGWVTRANKYPQEWRDERLITIEARAMV